MRLNFLLVFPWLIFSLSSCFEGDDSSSAKKESGYAGYVPNFSVGYPSNVLTSNLLLKSMMRAAPSSIPSLVLEEEPDEIDCSDAIANWDKSTQLPNATSGSNNVPYCPTASGNVVDCFNNELGVVLRFYAQTQFYDCNARQQLQEDGLTEQCRLRGGTGGSIDGDDLCDPAATAVVQLLYSLTEKASVDDFTRFISWTMHPMTPKDEGIKGRLISKDLQSDGSKTKVRVDIDRTGGKKAISSVLLTTDAAGAIISISRAYFNEAGSGNAITDNYITARYWHKDYAKVIAVRSHVNVTLGLSVFYSTCAAADAIAAINVTCDPATPTYYNSNGAAIGSAPAGIITNPSDSKFNARDSGDKLGTFFNNTTALVSGRGNNGIETIIENFFDPGLFSPAN